MLMTAALLVSVDAYHLGRSLVSVKRRGDVRVEKIPMGKAGTPRPVPPIIKPNPTMKVVKPSMTKTRVHIAAIAIMAALTACKTDLQALKEQAQAYVAAHPDPEQQTAGAIASNGIHEGMTMEQVTAAWGEPVEVQRFRGGAVQYWFFGCHWPHHCGGADIGMSPEERYQSRALFEGGKVVQWQD